jgi:hypothetical protein
LPADARDAIAAAVKTLTPPDLYQFEIWLRNADNDNWIDEEGRAQTTYYAAVCGGIRNWLRRAIDSFEDLSLEDPGTELVLEILLNNMEQFLAAPLEEQEAKKQFGLLCEGIEILTPDLRLMIATHKTSNRSTAKTVAAREQISVLRGLLQGFRAEIANYPGNNDS